MQPSARLYHCARCHTQVVICRRCDRGHRYCTADCARLARAASLQRSAKRYGLSSQGRRANAERQRRYRQRHQNEKNKKVTQQGSTHNASAVQLSPDTPRQRQSENPLTQQHPYAQILCHWCSRLCDPFLRNDFVHTSVRQHAPVMRPT